MRAVIDIGTNSTLLLIGRLNNKQNVENILQKFNVTRLGEGVHQKGFLNDMAVKRTMDVLQQYEREIKIQGSMPVHVIGTQALREAKNAHVFREMVKRKFNWDVRVLSGDEEAEYSFFGALDGIQSENSSVIVMDLGGGSTEIIAGDENNVIDHQSMPLGVVRAAEKLGMRANLSNTDSNLILEWSKIIFEQLSITFQVADSRFIGVGGTITTLAAIKEKMREYDPDKINGYALSKNDLWTLYDDLNSMTLNVRRTVPGLARGREDVILFGTLIFIAFMDYIRIDHVHASDRGLRFGVLKREELQEIS
jgi:exopolyphosphatase/guanosine-5'-triphosphate,3'-diphosphate pyrophosphatase